MSDVNKLAVKITGDESGLKKATKAAKKDIQSVGKEALSMGDLIKGAAIGSAIGNLVAGAIAGIGRAISNEMDSAFKRFDALNNYSKVMSNLRIGTDDSSTSIAILDQKLRGLPTSLSDAALGVQRFTAANGNIQASTDMYLAFNNAILAGGAATETQATGMEQLIQAYSKGKADAQEWRAMLIAMPAQLKQIAEAMGYTSTAIGGDFQTALNKGEVSMNDFALTAIKLNKEGANGFQSFADQAKNATNGVQTAITNMKIAIQRGIANIMQVLGQANVSGFFNGIANAIDTASNYIAAFITIIKEAVAWVAALFGWGGSGSTEQIVQATGDASTALAGAAAGAEDTAGGLDDAAGAAKKLRKQLAAFDEMNVLQEKESEGGAGGAGAGGGGGAAGTGGLDYKWDTSGLDKAKDKIAEYVEKIKKALKGLFGDIDFTALGNSIKKLGKGLKNAIDGALQIGQKFITEFVQPLTKFALENAVPRVFTAIGDALASVDFSKIAEAAGHAFGGLEKVGETLLNIWAGLNEILAPIGAWLANFVVPPALEIIGTILNTIASVINGIWNAVMSFYEGAIKPLLEALAGVFEPILDFLNDLFGGLNENNALWETFSSIIQGVAEFLLNILKPAFEAIGWVLTNVVKPVVEAVVGVFRLFTDALGITTSSTREYETTQDRLEQATNRAAEASERQKQAIEEVSNAQLAASNAELRLLDLTKEATDKRNKYNQMVNAGTYSQEDLTRAQLEAEIAEGRLEAQMDTLKNATQDTINAQEDYINSITTEIAETTRAEMYRKAAEGDFEGIYTALEELMHGEHEFALKSGESFTMTEDMCRSMAGGILDEIDNTEQGFSDWLDWTEQIGHNIRGVFERLRESARDNLANTAPSGEAFADGVARGIIKNKWVVQNAARELAEAGKTTFNYVLSIKSPSRVMAESGGYFVEGVEMGIKKEAPALEKMTSDMGTAMVDAFNTAPKFRDLGSLDIADQFSDLTAKAQGTLELQNEATNGAIDQLAQAINELAEKDQRVVVKIGEETLIDKVVDGINNASRMRNQTVLQL